MGKQIVISIGREFGSGGHEIGKLLAKKLGLEFVDKQLLENICGDNGIKDSGKYDEKPRNVFSRSVRGYSASKEQGLAEQQFAFLKAKAIADDSFVVIGRCSNMLFKEICPCVSIFVSGNRDDKIRRVMERTGKNQKEASKLIDKTDKQRAAYHNSYCSTKWDNACSYDVCVNSSVLGIEATADFLYDFIQKFRNR